MFGVRVYSLIIVTKKAMSIRSYLPLLEQRGMAGQSEHGAFPDVA